jgi:uncharacterized protein YkwD
MRLQQILLSATGVALLAAGAAATPGTPHAGAAGPCDAPDAGIDASEQQMFALVNATRAANGLAPLKLSPALNRAAAWKSSDSSAFLGPAFSHTDSLGRSAFTRVRDCGYPNSAVGEIIAYVSTTPATTLAAWMDSPGHRSQILESHYRVLGIGGNGRAWTIDFGAVDDSGSTPPLPPLPPAPTATPTAPPSPTPAPTPSPTSPAAAPPPPAPPILAVPPAPATRAYAVGIANDANWQR